jgi:triphosphatase
MGKEPDPPVEVELKLEVEPDDLDKVLAHPLLCSNAGKASRKQRLHSTYFDTPDHVLKQAGISLRIRRNGTQRIQTIKAAQVSSGVALTREEWEHEVDSDQPDLAVAKQTALKPFLKLREVIRPIFTVVVERTLHELPHGRSLIEVAADRGQVEGQARTLSFGEVELELKQGTAADLFGLALILAEAAPLRLSFKTKAERGFEAVSADKPKRVKAGPIALRRRMTSVRAFQVIGASCLKHLMTNESIVRDAPEADAVHQMRVALRRLRAAITLFKTIVADERRDQIKAELKGMANLLGEARDLDVYIATVLEPARIQHENDAGLETLLAETEGRRKRAYEKVQETIVSARFVNGILEAAAWIEAGNWALDDTKATRKRQDLPVSMLAEEELRRRWKRILKLGRRLAELDPEERHQVRIEIKKLRYATEFFESLFKGKGARKRKQAALKTLEALQETLGELNDIAVGAHMTTSAAAEAIHQEQRSRVKGLLAAAKTQYQDLAALKHFWEK